MIVDDDASLLKLLSIRLSRYGYRVETVDCAKSAIATVPVFKPDVVITDLRMQDMDGMALFRVLHTHQPLLPIIILTAHGTIPDAVEATNEGVFAYLTKAV